MVLLLMLDITVTRGMLANEAALNLMFGSSKQTVISNNSNSNADYYEKRYVSSNQSKEKAILVAKQISDEGIVLLKNDGLLPLTSQTPISPLGFAFFEPYYGGSGSSAISTNANDVTTPLQGLEAVFSNLNLSLIQQQENNLKVQNSIVPIASLNEQSVLNEFNLSVYEGFEESLAGTVGIVYIKRQTGENQDACLTPYEDGTPHMLAITSMEKALIDHAVSYCQNVVVVLCSSSPMEIGTLKHNSRISAILWVGGTGSTGYRSLGDILIGKINPSGRLPATYAADFRMDPSYPNQDDGTDNFIYTNALTSFISSTSIRENSPAAFHEFEEGIYVGYKYYETADALGHIQYENPKQGVVYPFGFGLSYTEFKQQIIDFQAGTKEISLTIRVENIGQQYSGKDVVQLYVTAPYTKLDMQYGIEKSSVQLIAFSKSKLLAPGETEEITLTFPIEEMASYCYTKENSDGTVGCYMLEEGSYVLSLRQNAHNLIDQRTYYHPNTIWYNSANPRTSEIEAQTALDANKPTAFPVAATNQFPELNAYMTSKAISGAVILSRSNWQNTLPTAPRDTDRIASQAIVKAIAEADTLKADLRKNISSTSLIDDQNMQDENERLILADLRGRSCNDPLWQCLMNQLTFENIDEICQALFEAGYKTGAIKEIGKPASVERDGPQGLTMADVSGKNWIKNVCGYPAAPIMAATFNKDLMYDYGFIVGQEALCAGINGWYAPGLNILRSPFCGRSSEYFSEDALLSGMLGAKVVSGAGDAGLYCAMKHFPIMDIEAHRSPHTLKWLTEQALRELYLKPFEIVVKTARKTIRYIPDIHSGSMVKKTMRAGDFIMASDSAVGSVWSAANHALITNIVRGEWGFEGAVISDMHVEVNYRLIDNLLFAGSDALMSINKKREIVVQKPSSEEDKTALKNAVKNICYVLVNSNLMQGIPPASVVEHSLSNWMLWLIAINGIVILLILLGAALCIQEFIKLRRNP